LHGLKLIRFAGVILLQFPWFLFYLIFSGCSNAFVSTKIARTLQTSTMVLIPNPKTFICVWLSARFLIFLPCLCFSAGKYLTAVPVIFLSALKYYIDPDTWTYSIQPAWILSGLANTFFSFFWDILRDWDLRYCECKTYYSNLGFSVIFRFLTSLLLVVSSLGFSNSPDQIFSPIYYMDAVG